MPWEKHGGGYRKEGADSGKGGFVKNPRQYEKLKAKYGKERAAAITNSFGKSAFGVEHTEISKGPYPGGQWGPNATPADKKRAKRRSAAVGGAAGLGGGLMGGLATKPSETKSFKSIMRSPGGKVGAGLAAGALGAHVVGTRRDMKRGVIQNPYKKQGGAVAKSAFGVEHGDIYKARRKKPSAGRVATGAVVPGWHGAFAGKKGHKLRAAGNEYGGSFVGGLAGAGLTRGNPLGGLGGSLAGGAAGTMRAHKKGHYKRQK